jgi:hypothetical protein
MNIISNLRIDLYNYLTHYIYLLMLNYGLKITAINISKKHGNEYKNNNKKLKKVMFKLEMLPNTLDY